jgi:divalent metal cation (Fe/Co/Zn/Cd) transporter
VTKRRALILPAVIVGIVLLVVAVLYFVEPAKSLPSFFPGHDSGSTHHHTKHGIVALVVALGAFAFAWFQTGPASDRQTAT